MTRHTASARNARSQEYRQASGWRGLAAAAGLGLSVALAGVGCQQTPIGVEHELYGDEIVVAGRFFRTGTPVVPWIHHEGYDAYRPGARFKPWDQSSWEAIKEGMPDWGAPARYNLRQDRFHAEVPELTEQQIEQVRDGQWELDELAEVVDQFVIHYDVCGVSEHCFRVLHDMRSLSVHFMLDVDGTIYQTLDLQERAWHAGKANSRSIGIEIANIGAYPPAEDQTLAAWYPSDEDGPYIDIPERLGKPRTPGFVARPSSPEPIYGEIHGRDLKQYDLTDEQYEALARLTATLSEVLPKIALDAPRDAEGVVRTDVLSDDEYAEFSGLIGHYHLTTGKIDPGPAFDWERVLDRARALTR
jgi:N-acetyl-anhydromuramyl-L-alanine amidase AmpD